MASLFDAADQFRAELLNQERRAATELVRAYGASWVRIRQQLGELAAQITQAKTRGEEISPAWLFQAERLQRLQRQVAAEFDSFARFADSVITAEQRAAVDAAQQHAEQLTRLSMGKPPPGVTVSFARLPAEELRDLVGFLQDGSPLRELLDEFGPAASRDVQHALVTGLVTGLHPNQIARQIRQALGGQLARALRICRTEILRSYREATRRSYAENRDLVTGWIWHSALGPRTCPSCWAMHGTIHALTERLDDHPNGRCAMVPLTKSWADLGFPDVTETRPQVTLGPVLFAKLSPAEQERILGPALYQLYRDGHVDLPDLVRRVSHPRWGTMRTTKTLQQVLAELEERARKPALPALDAADIPHAAQDREAILLAQSQLFFGEEISSFRLRWRIADALVERIPWDDFQSEFRILEQFWRELDYLPSGHAFNQKDAIFLFLETWAETSADNHPLALAIQLAAKEEFGLQAALPFTPATQPDKLPQAQALYQQTGRLLRQFLRAMYDHTQEYLAEKGVDRVLLVRGMVIPKTDRRGEFTAPIALQPLSSFATRSSSATNYAYHPLFSGPDRQPLLLYTWVPRERILSLAMTGFGCKLEEEFVVLGQPPGQADQARTLYLPPKGA